MSSLKYIPPSMCEPHFGQFGAEHIEITFLTLLGSRAVAENVHFSYPWMFLPDII